MKDIAKDLLLVAGLGLFNILVVGVGYSLVGDTSNIQSLLYLYCAVGAAIIVFGTAYRLFKERRFIRLQLLWRQRRRKLIESEFKV